MQYGRYQIIAELGRGSMGVVYKAHDPQIDRTIALKVLREDRVTSEDFVKRFLKEAMAVGRLSHPGIVTVYDVGQDRGSIYIAMEFLQGMPLDELMATKSFSLDEIVNIGIQTAQALQYAHQHGIIHRDIKPPNIIYSPEGSIRVTDFGIARIEDPNGHQMTQVGEILGTPRYMSPEQVMGQPLDGQSDLYSLGVILYQLTTGRRPFQGDTLAAIFRAITQDTPEAPHTLDPRVPEALSSLIMKLLDKDPARRFSSGNNLIGELRGCLTPQSPAHTTPAPPVTPTKKKGADIGKVVIAGLLGLIICAGLGGYYFLRPQPKPVSLSHETPRTDNTQKTVTPQQQNNQADSKDNSLSIKPPTDQQEINKITSENQTLLKMDSQPSGADLFIDGSHVGTTPAHLTIAAGKHEVKLKLDNYLGWEAQLDLSEGGQVPLSIRLLPEPQAKQDTETSHLADKKNPSSAIPPSANGSSETEGSLKNRQNKNSSLEIAPATKPEPQSNQSTKTPVTSRIKGHSAQPVEKQSSSGKRASLSPICQTLLKRYELGDASVIARYQKECSGQ